MLFSSCLLWQIHPLLAKKISSLAENTSPKTVFDEVLANAGRDTVTKDVSRLRGGWPMQDAFYVSLSLFSVRTCLLHSCIDYSLFILIYNLVAHINDHWLDW